MSLVSSHAKYSIFNLPHYIHNLQVSILGRSRTIRHDYRAMVKQQCIQRGAVRVRTNVEATGSTRELRAQITDLCLGPGIDDIAEEIAGLEIPPVAAS